MRDALSVESANEPHFVIRQFGVWESFATCLCAMPFFVGLVLYLGPPCQILQPVVRGISVEVTALRPPGAETDKRFKHKMMNISCITYTECNLAMTTSFLDVELEPFPFATFLTPRRAIIADAIAGLDFDVADFGRARLAQHWCLLQSRCRC
jgi:hypothetical protein